MPTLCWVSVEYERRRPENTPLYRVIQENLHTFVAMMDEADRMLPKYVVHELERFLDCGILAKGFARVRCRDCGFDRLVAFACKGRSLCPSCVGRHMNEAAAHLHDNIIGYVPVRHWVLTVPPPLRYLLAWDTKLCGDVLDFFRGEIFGWLKRKAKKELGLSSVHNAHPASVTVIHRASSHLALNVHFHSLVADGVFVQTSPDAEPTFRALPAPTKAEVVAVAWATCKRTVALLQRQGRWMDTNSSEDLFAQDEPGLSECYRASLSGVLLLGSRAGKRVMRLYGSAPGFEDTNEPQAQTPGFGFSVHAKHRVSAKDRKGLERLARYVTRPPVANKRLTILPDGRILWTLKRAWQDGTNHLVFEPLDFLSKLAAIVFPPRIHRVRYHGAWARRSKLKALVAPKRKGSASKAEGCRHREAKAVRKRCRYDWAKLFARVFKVDVLKCPRCESKMQRIAWIQKPDAIRAILSSVGLPCDSPQPAPARLSSPPDLFDVA